MKKILLFLSLLFLAIACEKNPIIDEPTNGVYDPEATIKIKPAQTKGFIYDMSAMDIVTEAFAIRWRTHYSDNIYSEVPTTPIRRFDDLRDFDIPALLMSGMDILHPVLVEMHPNSEYGMFRRDFMEAWDIYVIDNNYDTIAYVPTEVVHAARPLIWQAYVDSNYNEVYRLFDEAFTFLPIEQKK